MQAGKVPSEQETQIVANVEAGKDEKLQYLEEQFNLEKRKLELEKERFELEKEKAEFRQREDLNRIELKLKELEIAARSNELTHKNELSKINRRSDSIQRHYKNVVSLILLGSGIWFTYSGENLGPYIMGAGATGIGIEASNLMRNGNTSSSQENEKSEK